MVRHAARLLPLLALLVAGCVDEIPDVAVSRGDVTQDAEAIAWVSTWAIFHRPQQGANVLAAAKQAGVKRVVYSSFVGAGLGVDEQCNGLTKDVRKDLPFLPQDFPAILVLATWRC